MIVRVADKSKTVKRRRRKVRASKTSARSGQDRPTAETQNQGNLMTQSHGSTVNLLFVTTIARLPKSTPFAGMTERWVIPAWFNRFRLRRKLFGGLWV
jgi:hypothetical protein